MAQTKQNTVIEYTYDERRSFLSKMLVPMFWFMGTKKIVQNGLKKTPTNHRKAKMPKNFPKQFDIDTHQINGHTIWTFSPKNEKTDKTILYLHGGAYMFGLQTNYWIFIRDLVQTTNANVVVADYPLIPEYAAADVYSFMDKTYE